MKDPINQAKVRAVQILTESFAKGRTSIEEFEQACEDVESAESVENVMALLERVSVDIVEYVKEQSVEQDRQIIRGEFSKQKKRGNWLRSRRLFVAWSFGRIRLDLREALTSMGSGRTVNLDLHLKYAKCTIIVPRSVGIIDKIETFEQGKLHCPQSAFNRSGISPWTVVLEGRVASSRVNISVRNTGTPWTRRVFRRLP